MINLTFAQQTAILNGHEVSFGAVRDGDDPVDATISASEITYWVGTGSTEVIFVGNWCSPEVALAWGVRFNGNSTTVEAVMDTIAAYDSRFGYSGGGSIIYDVTYQDSTNNLSLLQPSTGYVMYNVNGILANFGYTDMYVSQGDLIKVGNTDCATMTGDPNDWTTWGYAWETVIMPVTAPGTSGGDPDPGPGPDPDHGPFCGSVGTDGCNAIPVGDNSFVDWATGVVLTRGPYMITEPDGPFASFGGDTNAIGPATLNNTMDAVSLGDGGSALVTFERPIRNGEGPDFAVFENSFNDTFLELAFVEVSSDGVHFVRFPATSLTPTDEQVSGAVGGVDATMINNLAGKFRIGYGTPFDLEELADSANLNIDSIVYVRIVDVVGTIDPQYATYDAFGHIVNDPWPTNFWSSGFDLTGVGVINSHPVGVDNREMPQVFAYPNPCNGTLYIINQKAERIELYSSNGQLLDVVENGDTQVYLNMQSYPAGLYLLKVGNGVQKVLKK